MCVPVGVFKGAQSFDVYIDVKAIPELHQVEVRPDHTPNQLITPT